MDVNFVKVTDLLREMGADPSLQGYSQIRTAVMWAVKDETYIYGMTTRLYPDLAKHFNTTPARVERNIRHCVESIWNKGNTRTLDRVFGHISLDKPKNSAFIAGLADYLKVYEGVVA